MNLSKKMKELRTYHNYTQKQVAAMLNIHRSSYSYYESGRVTPPLPTLIAIAKIFNVSVDDLLSYTPDSQKQPPRRR